jgi:hypothetical protein
MELRSEGYSIEKLSQMLRKSKQTLLQWNRELQEEISILKSINSGEEEELIEYRINDLILNT